MIARYQTKCRACGEYINPGDQIVRARNARIWVHASCPVEKPEADTSAQDNWNDPYGGYGADPEAMLAARERAAMDAEYNRGVADAETYLWNKRFMGEEYAEAEEMARELRDPEGW